MTKSPTFISRSSGERINGKHVSEMNHAEREDLSRNSMTTSVGKPGTKEFKFYHPQHGYFTV